MTTTTQEPKLSPAQYAKLRRAAEETFALLRHVWTTSEKAARREAWRRVYCPAPTRRKLQEYGYVEYAMERETREGYYTITYEGIRRAGCAPGSLPAYAAAAEEKAAAERAERAAAEAELDKEFA